MPCVPAVDGTVGKGRRGGRGAFDCGEVSVGQVPPAHLTVERAGGQLRAGRVDREHGDEGGGARPIRGRSRDPRRDSHQRSWPGRACAPGLPTRPPPAATPTMNVPLCGPEGTKTASVQVVALGWEAGKAGRPRGMREASRFQRMTAWSAPPEVRVRPPAPTARGGDRARCDRGRIGPRRPSRSPVREVPRLAWRTSRTRDWVNFAGTLCRMALV